MGKLTTHVLDTATGKPGAGIRIDLYFVEGEDKELLKSVTTNSDGRCDGPLLEEDELQVGTYELAFHAGDYFDNQGLELPDPKFLNIVTLPFGISNAEEHYHVPLLVSPYSYSTYRGS